MSALLRNFLPAVAPHPPGRASEGTPTGKEAPLVGTDRSYRVTASSDPVELVTLLTRIETSSVLDERRRALRACADMLASPASASKMIPSVTKPHLAMLMAVLQQYNDQNDIVVSVLEVLCAVASSERHATASLLAPAMKADVYVALLRDGTFWAKYNSVTLMTYLHRLDPAGFSAQLLQTGSGVGQLVDVLNDDSNDDALRNEGLSLFRELTGPHGSTELQSVLAFENCFESLFSIIRAEGGLATGSVIVRDCIEVIQNMLRSNKNTQKFFREMNHLKDLAALLDVQRVPTGEWEASVTESLSQCVQTVLLLLKAGDGSGEGGDVRTAMFVAGLTTVLSDLALSVLPTQRRDEAETLEVELLRTLCLALTGSKTACDAFLKHEVSSHGSSLPAVWCTLRSALSDTNGERLMASATLLYQVLLCTGSSGANVLTNGLAPKTTNSLACGALLGTYLFAVKKPNTLTLYVSSHFISGCIARSVSLAEQIVTKPWDNSTTFFAAYVRYAISLLETRQLAFPDGAAVIRVIVFALRTTPKALLMLLSDDVRILFFAEWAVACRDGAHIPYLCAAVVALAVALCPSSLPAGAKYDQESLRNLLLTKITAQRYITLRDTAMSTSEWTAAPRGGALGDLPKTFVYDGPLINLLQEIDGSVSPLFVTETSHVVQPTTPVNAPTSTTSNGHKLPESSPLPAPSTITTHAPDSDKLAVEIERLKALLASAESRAATAERNAIAAEKARSDAVLALHEQSAAFAADNARKEAGHQQQLAELRQQHEEMLRQKETDLKELAATIDHLQQKLRECTDALATMDDVRSSLNEALRDRDELLILVAELDELCVDHRGDQE